MPANTKYLTQSKWQRFAKFTAGFIGGYLVAASLHLALAAWCNLINVMITSTFSMFIIWAALMVAAYMGKNGWKTWGLYLLLSAVLLGLVYIKDII